MEVATARFRTSQQASHNVFTLPRLLLRPLMPLPVVISFLRLSCWISPWSLMPLLHSVCPRHLFPYVRPSEVPLATLSPVQFFRRLCSTVGPLRPRHLGLATPARWVIFLRAAAKSFRDPPSPWVRFFSCRRRPMARSRPRTASSVLLKFPLRSFP
jgi:hypothetical protein